MSDSYPRTSPHDQLAEESVLGGILLRPELLPALELEPQHFFGPRHAALFECMQALHSDGKSIDATNLVAELRRREKLDFVGGPSLLSKVALRVPYAESVKQYAATVLELHGKRTMLALFAELLEDGYDPTIGLGELQGRAMQGVRGAIRDGALERGAQPISQILKRVAARLDSETQGKAPTVSTGFNTLDERLGGGFRGGEFFVLAGRPGMGKSALGILAALHAATAGAPALVFSLEMSGEQLAERLIAARAEIGPDRLRQAKVSREDMVKLIREWSAMSKLPMAVDSSAGITIGQLQSRAWRFASDHTGPGLIVVDYLQILRGTENTRKQNREREISEISNGLLDLSKQLEWPVLAISQLNRSVEGRSDKRPMLSDLRESGSIEQDADGVLLLYRDEYYNPNTEEPGLAEVNIAKWRHGRTGTFKLRFKAEFTRFEDLSLIERARFDR